jgi:hypothetical protein
VHEPQHAGHDPWLSYNIWCAKFYLRHTHTYSPSGVYFAAIGSGCIASTGCLSPHFHRRRRLSSQSPASTHTSLNEGTASVPRYLENKLAIGCRSFGQNSFKPGDRTAEIQSRAELFYIPTLCRLGAASLTPGKHIYLPNQQLPQKPAVPADRWRHHVAHVLRGNERTDSAMVTKNIVSRSGHGPKTVLL